MQSIVKKLLAVTLLLNESRTGFTQTVDMSHKSDLLPNEFSKSCVFKPCQFLASGVKNTATQMVTKLSRTFLTG